MALKNLFGKAMMAAPACGSACGAGDKNEEACGVLQRLTKMARRK